MGELMRRYWLPLLLSIDLSVPDCDPRRVRVLGEDLVAFRDSSGQVGLLAEGCPHRGASLFFGRNEECGLRCVYHGWKFDHSGRCVDMPTEPAESPLSRGVHATAYACRERQGIVWAYLGPRAEPPPLPEPGWALVPAPQRGALRYQRACNWLQALEGDIDTAHLGWLHARFGEDGGREIAFSKEDHLRDIAARDTRPVLEVVDTSAGIVVAARRDHGPSDYYWRITQFHMPIFTSVPAIGSQRRAKAWVPIDDTHTLVWEPNWHPTDALSPENRSGQDRIPASGIRWDEREPGGRFVASRENDYLIDRERQRLDNYSGIEESPPLQDAAIQESMGPIVDRSREHLGSTDVAIIRVRQRLRDAALRLRESGEEPPGVETPAAYHPHGIQMVLPRAANWRQALEESVISDSV